MGSGVEQLVRLLLHDVSFAKAVQQRDGETAAAAAVGLVKSHFKSFASVLRPPRGAAAASLAPLDSSSPTAAAAGAAAAGAAAAGGGGAAAKRASDAAPPASGGGRRVSDAAGQTTPKWTGLRANDRVLVNVSHKRADTDTQGKQGVITTVAANGWVKVQVCGEILDFQMRQLTLISKAGAAGAAGAAAAAAGGGTGASQQPGSSSLGGGKGDLVSRLTLKGASGRPSLRKLDAIKTMRREVAALEEEVPWKAVSERWRSLRQRWVKAVRGAETTPVLAQLMGELHDHLATDKGSGLFAARGPWEEALGACARGEANHVALAGCWEEMKAGLRSWLAAGSLPGGLEGLDRASYEAALATYAVLQDAAMRGPDQLEQVPLDQILTTQRDVLALHHIIQREHASAHARLQALVSHSTPAAAQLQPLQLPDLQGGELSDALLMQLAKLPRLRRVAGLPAAGDDDDVDTDRDSGSDATDVEELDLMVLG